MISGKMYRFRFDPQFVLPEYIEAYLQSGAAWLAIDRMKTGGSDSGLNLTMKRFRGLRVPLAPLAEQRRIVHAVEEHFTRIDAAEATLRRALGRAELVERLAIEALFDNQWPTVKLGQVLREPLRNGHSAPRSVGSAGVRTLTLTAVTTGDFCDANTKLTGAVPEKVSDLWLQDGDIFVERSNTPELVGSAALYRGPSDWAIFPDLLIRVRPDDSVLPEFALLSLQTVRARRYFQAAAQGIAGSMPKISQGTVSDFTFQHPPTKIQAKVVEAAERLQTGISRLRAEVNQALARSVSLRQSVLAAAFAGRLLHQDPEDEPAQVLLDRIAEERAVQKPGAARGRRKVAS